jgi:predicted anti-sigma-YlaC factor YlaD
MMMECDAYREWMSLSLDGQLAQVEEQQLKAHVAICSSCRAVLADLRHVDRLLNDAPMVGPAPGFTARFEARLAARRRRHRTWAGFVILSLATLGIMLGMMSLLAIPGLTLWENLSASGLLPKGVSLMLELGKAAASTLNLAWLVVSALARGMRHPVFIVYVMGTAILFVAWTQIVARRVAPVRSVAM